MFESKLRALAASAETAARPPAFGDLIRRARVRRLRRRATASFATLTAGAVAAVLAVNLSGTPRGTSPVHPGPTAATSSYATSPPPSRHYLLKHPVALLHQPDAEISDVSYADPNHAAALWYVCSAGGANGACPGVLTWTSDGWRSSRAMVIPDKLNIYALPDGSVVVWLYGNNSFVVAPDGTTRKLTLARHPISASPGGPLTNLPGINGTRPAGMLDEKTATVYPPLTAPSTRCEYDDHWDGHGRIWEIGTPRCGPTGNPTVAWSSDLGRTWSTHRTGQSTILGLAVSPSRTAVLLSRTQKDEHDILAGLDVTEDGGRHWRHASLPPDMILAPGSIATTTKGGMLIADGTYLWKANSQWTAFRKLYPRKLKARAVTGGDQVLCAYGGSPDKAWISTDDGQTWRSISPRP